MGNGHGGNKPSPEAVATMQARWYAGIANARFAHRWRCKIGHIRVKEPLIQLTIDVEKGGVNWPLSYLGETPRWLT